jgi:hypothetical protein
MYSLLDGTCLDFCVKNTYLEQCIVTTKNQKNIQLKGLFVSSFAALTTEKFKSINQLLKAIYFSKG